MKQSLKYKKALNGALLAGGLLLAACTGQFEGWNINPNEVTPGQMEQDNLLTGAFFTQMERGIFVVGKDKGGLFEETQMLTGDIFASYCAPIKTWNYAGNEDNDCYKLYPQWYNSSFKNAYLEVMKPWHKIVQYTDETSPARAMANIVKVFGMSRITDKYGPIPYSQFGKGIQVAYDSQKDVYYKFFEELASAIDILTEYNSHTSSPYMEEYDFVYNGRVSSWIKFANTLRLRLAMRVSFVDEAKARTEAQAAITHSVGLMASASDNAILKQAASFTFINEWWEAYESFNDFRMSATMDCYLNGLKDPRLAVYFSPAKKSGEYKGVRNGQTSRNQGTLSEAASSMNVSQTSSIVWMDAAEAYFLQAEAKLRLGLGDKSVQEYYEEGVKTSFSSKGATGAETYLADDTNVPSASYVDPARGTNTNVSAMVSKLTVKWDDAASEENKLERIMVQKWIALFPDGVEAWSEMRRTGYPGIVTISTNASGGEVKSGELISRLKFPTTEYSDNSANTQAAVSLLNGQDAAGTRLWWDVKR